MGGDRAIKEKMRRDFSYFVHKEHLEHKERCLIWIFLSTSKLWCKTFQNTKVFAGGIELVQINLLHLQVGLESLENFLGAIWVRKAKSFIQLGVSSQEVREI